VLTGREKEAELSLLKAEYRTVWISAFDQDADLNKLLLQGWRLVCYNGQIRTSGDGTKGTFLRELQVVVERPSA